MNLSKRLLVRYGVYVDGVAFVGDLTVFALANSREVCRVTSVCQNLEMYSMKYHTLFPSC